MNDVDIINALAQEIRRIDGDNTLGAARLAEFLMPFLNTLVEVKAMQENSDMTQLRRAGVKMLTVEVKDMGHTHTLAARRELAWLIPLEGPHISNIGDTLTIEAASRGEYGYGTRSCSGVKE